MTTKRRYISKNLVFEYKDPDDVFLTRFRESRDLDSSRGRICLLRDNDTSLSIPTRAFFRL